MVSVQGMRVSRKEVRPEILVITPARVELLQDLGRMGCIGVNHVTWYIDDVGIVAQEVFSGNTPRQFIDSPVRGEAEFWEESCWQMTYSFPEPETGYIKVRNNPSGYRLLPGFIRVHTR